jgi:hypothetical protein
MQHFPVLLVIRPRSPCFHMYLRRASGKWCSNQQATKVLHLQGCVNMYIHIKCSTNATERSNTISLDSHLHHFPLHSPAIKIQIIRNYYRYGSFCLRFPSIPFVPRSLLADSLHKSCTVTDTDGLSGKRIHCMAEEITLAHTGIS